MSFLGTEARTARQVPSAVPTAGRSGEDSGRSEAAQKRTANAANGQEMPGDIFAPETRSEAAQRIQPNPFESERRSFRRRQRCLFAPGGGGIHYPQLK